MQGITVPRNARTMELQSLVLREICVQYCSLIFINRYLLALSFYLGLLFRTFLRKSTKNFGLAFLRESVLGELKRHLCCGEVYVTFLYRSLGQSFPSKSDGQFVVWTSMWCCFAERVGLGNNNVLLPRGVERVCKHF